ncbi:hypothetical protein A4D02_24470 [Niastella koreensis]|nr:hypothetical protein A4D02_24470 [Niastella koreensis]
MLTYGMLELQSELVEHVVSPKYGFINYRVADCSVTKELKDSVARENKKVSNILEKRFGSDWEKKYNDEVAAILHLQAKAKALVKKEPYIADKMKLWNIDEYDGLLFLVVITDMPNVFDVFVSVYGKQPGEDEKVIKYELTVDVETNTVTQKNDTHKVTKPD